MATLFNELNDFFIHVGQRAEACQTVVPHLESLEFEIGIAWHGCRRASSRVITNVEHDEEAKYLQQVEELFPRNCDAFLHMVQNNQIPPCTSEPAKVFYKTMRADFHR